MKSPYLVNTITKNKRKLFKVESIFIFGKRTLKMNLYGIRTRFQFDFKYFLFLILFNRTHYWYKIQSLHFMSFNQSQKDMLTLIYNIPELVGLN